MSIKFSGVNIHAKDPVKSFEFYKGLGLTVTEEVADPNDPWYGAAFDLGGGTLWIWRDRGAPQGESQVPMTIQMVMTCEDIEKSYAELKERGYPVSEVEKMFYGGREMNLVDPDGNRILFLD